MPRDLRVAASRYSFEYIRKSPTPLGAGPRLNAMLKVRKGIRRFS